MVRLRTPVPEDFLGSLEAVIMKDLWRYGESSVGEVLARLNKRRNRPLAYNTVMSVMARLSEEKHLLDRRREGRAFYYAPVVDKEGFIHLQASRAMGEIVADFGTAGVAGFVRSVSSNPELRAELDRLLKEADEAGSIKGGP